VARTNNKSVAQGVHGRPSCFFCSLAQDDPLNVDLFEIGAPYWHTSYSEKRLKRIEHRLKRDKRPEACKQTAVKARNHYATHGAPQPVPNIVHIRHQLETLSDQLTNRDRDVLNFIGQARVVIPEQIAEGYWQSSPEKARLQQVWKQLHRLCLHNLIYRVPRPKDKDKRGSQGRNPSAYFLGKGGAELLGGLDNWPWIDHPERVDHRILHDLDVTQIFLDAHRSQADCDLGGLPGRAWINLHNCWAAPHLDVAVRFKTFYDTDGQMYLGGERLSKPDGLFAVSVELPELSFLAPVLIENETGSQTYDAVAPQIANYDLLAKSGAIKQRLPNLNIDGYDVPLVVIADAYRRGTSGSDAHLSRIAGLRRQVVAEFRKRGYKKLDKLPPIFIAYRGDWSEQGIHAPVWDVRQPEQQESQRRSALAELTLASQPLIEAGELDANSLLEIDPKAAFWKGKIMENREKSAKERKQVEGKQLAERQRIEELREKVRVQETTGGRS